jgi:diguanylate cyclase (GGDEF)-like protein
MSDNVHFRYLEQLSTVTGQLIEKLDDQDALSFVVETLSALHEEENGKELPLEAVLTLRILANLGVRLGYSGFRREQERRRVEETEQELQRMHQQLLKKNMALRERTMVDELTGLFNRRYFERSLNYDLERFRRYGRPFSVVMFDVDYFKKINDNYGHVAGDKSLKHLADMAKATVRSADLVARWGGEEFVLLLPETGAEGAITTAERFRKKVERATLDVDQGTLTMTISLGVVAVEKDYRGDQQIIMRSVDDALYRAKEGGRNRTIVAF